MPRHGKRHKPHGTTQGTTHTQHHCQNRHRQKKEIKKEKDKFRAICFLLRADENRYAELLDDLKKGVCKGCDKYPTTVSDAYKLLIRTSRQLGFNPRRFRNRNTNPRQCPYNFMFTQEGQGNRINNARTSIAGRNIVLHEDILCYACRRLGHYANECLNANEINLAHIST